MALVAAQVVVAIAWSAEETRYLRTEYPSSLSHTRTKTKTQTQKEEVERKIRVYVVATHAIREENYSSRYILPGRPVVVVGLDCS